MGYISRSRYGMLSSFGVAVAAASAVTILLDVSPWQATYWLLAGVLVLQFGFGLLEFLASTISAPVIILLYFVQLLIGDSKVEGFKDGVTGSLTATLPACFVVAVVSAVMCTSRVALPVSLPWC